jgi:dimethylhistidine N-methyltransferase
MCEAVRRVALRGLTAPQKTLPCSLFYDDAGAELFERICRTPEYYPTRTETRILTENIDEISAVIGAKVRLAELGSGSASKTRILLRRIGAAEYVPVDISRRQLRDTARALSREFASLQVNPLCVDYTEPWSLPAPSPHVTRTVIFFPGSTIGNFQTADAEAFLQTLASTASHQGGLLIGVDLHKDRARLEAAYNDAEGATAAFNLNILARLNREADANFRVETFRHQAIYDELRRRIEMRLVSMCHQQVTFRSAYGMGEVVVSFRQDEFIVTEHSYKHSIAGFAALAGRAGWSLQRTWLDPERLFAVHWLAVAR